MGSILSGVLPALGISFISYELPSMLGGALAVCVTGYMLKKRIGISFESGHKVSKIGENEEGSDGDSVVISVAKGPMSSDSRGKVADESTPLTISTSTTFGEVISRTFPLWALILILLITRIPAVGLRSLLTTYQKTKTR
jgi:hypothetical protein